MCRESLDGMLVCIHHQSMCMSLIFTLYLCVCVCVGMHVWSSERLGGKTERKKRGKHVEGCECVSVRANKKTEREVKQDRVNRLFPVK